MNECDFAVNAYLKIPVNLKSFLVKLLRIQFNEEKMLWNLQREILAQRLRKSRLFL